MPKMRAVQVPKPGAAFQIVEREIPQPPPGWVRIKVQACGICHSDSVVKEGLFPGIQYPRVPGHEVAGVIDSLGDGAAPWKVGQRVGAGWHGGYCGHCKPCRQGDLFACDTNQVTGLTHDGGYADYMLAPATSIAAIPDSISPVEAGPLMCAGITTFNALRNSHAISGDTVAILGIGGLGHLAVQFANKMGFNTVAIARGADKADFAKKLGAAHYIDSQSSDPAAELQKLGGAKVILATVTNADAMTAALGGLAIKGNFLLVGAVQSMTIPPLFLLMGSRSISGWYSGTSIDSEDTLAFSALSGVRSMNEIYPLEKAPEAYDRMMSGKARFRVVLTMGN